MPTAGCIRAGTVGITLMKGLQTEPAGTPCQRVGLFYIPLSSFNYFNKACGFSYPKSFHFAEIWDSRALLSLSRGETLLPVCFNSFCARAVM